MNDASIGSTDGGFEDVTIAIVTAVADRRGVEPIELPPLYEWIDPDSLAALFAPTRTGGPRRGRIEFVYDGHRIVVAVDDEFALAIDGTPVAEPITTDGSGAADEPWTSV